MKLRKINVKNNGSSNFKFKLFMMFTTIALFLSVGYSALNEDLSISSEAKFRIEKDIRITDLHLKETTNYGLEEYNSEYNVDSVKIGVGLPNLNSTVTYEVEVTNNGNVPMWIEYIIDEIKNNDNIEYTLDGISTKELINANTIKTFNIVFKYKSSVKTIPTNTKLDLKTLFKFSMPESVLAQGSNTAATSTFFNSGPIKKQEVESIEFRPNLEVGEDAIGYWDASQKKDGTVVAWYTDTDENKLYELYIGGIGKVYAPVNSSNLFRSFTKLTNINFGDYFDTSNVTNMGGMFAYCSLLQNADLSGFDTPKLTSVIYSIGSDRIGIFRGCTNLKSVDVSSLNMSNVSVYGEMFYGCSSLTELDLSSWDTRSLTALTSQAGSSIHGMFEGCSKLQKLDLSSFNTENVISMQNLFSGCSLLTSLDVSKFNTQEVVDMSNMFANCTSLTSLDLRNFNTESVTSMNGMFKGCSKLTTLNLSSFDTSNVTTMGNGWANGMFYNCSSLVSLDVSNFNTKNVKFMASMFQSCTSLTELDLSKFDTSNVTNMSYMFYNCLKLSNLDLSSFDTKNVTNMYSMFYLCQKISTLDLSSFDTSNVTNMSYMFQNCTSLMNLDIRNFDFTNVTTYTNVFTSVPASALITVKNQDAYNWVLDKRSNFTNVVIAPSA